MFNHKDIKDSVTAARQIFMTVLSPRVLSASGKLFSVGMYSPVLKISPKSCLQGTFHIFFFEFNLGSIGAFGKFPLLRFPKKLLLPHFSPKINFNQTLQKACDQGKCQLLLFLVFSQIVKVYI